MRSKYIPVAIVTAIVVGVLVYFYGGSQAPSGQLPLRRLSPQNVDELKNAFNAANDEVRVLVLLSPT